MSRVGVDRIEEELTALWQAIGRGDPRAAGGAGGGAGGPAPIGGTAPVTRAALWNVIVAAHGPAALHRSKALIDELTPAVPARVVLLCQSGDDGEPDGPAEEIQATIACNVVSSAEGTRVVYAEEVTLTGHGAGEEHFGALVRSLQLPGLRTATLWIDWTMPEALLTRELLPLTDRLVVDSGVCRGGADLASLARVGEAVAATQELADLGWLRLAHLRLMFAGLFDPPVGAAPLRAGRRFEIRHRDGNRASAELLCAWLGLQLGWTPLRAGRGATRETLRFELGTRDGEIAAVDLIPSGKAECGPGGIAAMALLDGAEPRGVVYGIRRTPGDHAELTLPGSPPVPVKLDSPSDAQLCAAALGPRGRDALFRRVLAYAGRLATLTGAARGADR